MAFTFLNWFFQKLPIYFTENDSYKDASEEGLLQRYLRNYGDEIDNEILPYIDNFPNLLGVKTTPDKMLRHLGFVMGLPPDLDGTYATYRRMLSVIIYLYKVKGTEASYKILFNILGLDVTISVIPNPNVYFKYDQRKLYDSGLFYDIICNPCVEYSLAYWDRRDDPTIATIHPVNPVVLQNLLNIIGLVEPIDARLKELMRAVNLKSNYTPAVNNIVDIDLNEYPLYDMGPNPAYHFYDTGAIYDNITNTVHHSYTF